MYKSGRSRIVLFSMLSLGLILMGATLFHSVFSQDTPNTFSVSSIILGKDKPLSVAFDQNTSKIYGIFATNDGQKNLLYVIDSIQNKVIDTIKIGSQNNDFLSNIALNPVKGIIYATGQHLVNENDTTIAYDSLYVINSSNNKYKRIQLYSEPEEGKEGSLAGISVNPVTNMIYIGSLYPDGGKPGMYVLDGDSLQSSHIDKWQYGIKDIQLDPESHLLYAGARYDNMISVINESNNKIVYNITAESPVAMTLNKEKKILYEVGTDGKVNAIDLSSKKNISSIQGKFVKNILYNPNDKLLYIIDQNMTNILSKNSNGTKSMAIAVNTTNNITNKFETDFIVENILINPSTNQAYLLGYDGNNSKLFIVKPH
jgi:hypothetical protein